MTKIGVYIGTFDPVTNGHLDIIERASNLFDKLYVVVAINPSKTGMFTIEERKLLLQESTKQFSNVIIDSTDLLSVEYAKSVGSRTLIRGLRSSNDFDFELQLSYYNQHIDNEIDTIFLMTKPNNSFISSSGIKEMASHNCNLDDLVPKCVNEALKEKIK